MYSDSKNFSKTQDEVEIRVLETSELNTWKSAPVLSARKCEIILKIVAIINSTADKSISIASKWTFVLICWSLIQISRSICNLGERKCESGAIITSDVIDRSKSNKVNHRRNRLYRASRKQLNLLFISVARYNQVLLYILSKPKPKKQHDSKYTCRCLLYAAKSSVTEIFMEAIWLRIASRSLGERVFFEISIFQEGLFSELLSIVQNIVRYWGVRRSLFFLKEMGRFQRCGAQAMIYSGCRSDRSQRWWRMSS